MRKGFAGIWKLDRKRSDIPPITRSQVLKIETDGENLMMRQELINDKDERFVISVEGRFDAKEYPVIGTPFADSASYRLVNPQTIEGTVRKDGRVCVRETARLSDEGHSLRVEYEMIDEKGIIHEAYAIFERISESS